MAFVGFRDGLNRWVGPRPPSPADLERQRAAADAVDAAERERQAELRRPVNERIAELAARALATLPAELRERVKATEAERARLADRVSETQRELEALEANPPAESALDAWVQAKMRCELQLPHLRRLAGDANQAAAAALEAARAALKPTGEELYKAAAEGYLRVIEENKQREKEAERDRGIADAARSRVRNVAAADL